jgi:hypothetical protein
MAHHLDEGTRQPSQSWALLLVFGLCVEFWIIVTTAVAQKL